MPVNILFKDLRGRDWRVKSGNTCYTVGKIVRVKNKDGDVVESISNPHFYTRITDMAEYLLEAFCMDSNAVTFAELIEVANDAREHVRGILNGV